MTDQNKYHCETCEFKGKGMMGDERCPYDTNKSNEDNCDLLYSFKRTEEEKKLIELCGLACHSDIKQPCLQEENQHLKNTIKNATTRLELRRHHAHEQGNFEREDAMDESLTLITGKEIWERVETSEVE